MNHVSLIGNLTRDPELKYVPSGTALCELDIAVNRKWKKGDDWKTETTVLDAKLWGGWAENFAGQKGDKVCIVGRLSREEWEDRQGNRRFKVYVTALEAHVVASGAQSKPPPQKKQEPAQDDLDLDSIPF